MSPAYKETCRTLAILIASKLKTVVCPLSSQGRQSQRLDSLRSLAT